MTTFINEYIYIPMHLHDQKDNVVYVPPHSLFAVCGALIVAALDMAIEYWKLLLQERWAYLDLWLEFLKERYNKTIPKDTWNLLYDFIEDIGTNFDLYDENGTLSFPLT